MSRLPPRLKLLRTTLRRPHRYRRYRGLAQAASLALLAAVPASHLAGVDVWGGQHYWLFERVGGFIGGLGLFAAVLGFYAITFVVNLFAARTFCGWACPVGQLQRFGDIAQARAGRGAFGVIAYSAALAALALSWFAAPAVLVYGSARAIAIALGVFVGLAGVLVLHARTWRWQLCRKACPIGLYYSVIQLPRPVHIVFDDRDGLCKDCDVCRLSCPVQLDPRHLDRRVRDIGGLAIDDMPGTHHCLHCGVCVEVCERVTGLSEDAPPLGFGRPPRAGS